MTGLSDDRVRFRVKGDRGQAELVAPPPLPVGEGMTTQFVVTEQEQCWALGGEVLDQGMAHPALKAVTAELDALAAALAEAQRASAGLKKAGCGRTEDPALVIARVVPRLRSLGETAALVADQLEARLRRG